MASLDKLAIRGIRSFGDKELAVIEFYSPVTVIVGHNGSGKTTIIECLKYATTGDQPPNTKGGAFVHDPKIANEKEVKAQVKLRFFSANRNKMLAIRNLSVTVKKTGLTMKTLESILATHDYDRKSKRGVISTKCAQMDIEIPNLLGVSKAVLENVIFCHQEDSYWPLAEASVLKKKFDDIFEATKYTKALDSIKNLRKERVSELKADKERLQSLQIQKSHADKLRTKIEELSSTLESKEEEQSELNEEIQQKTTENAKFLESATTFKQTYLTVQNLDLRRTQLEQDIERQEATTEELADSDGELQSKMANFSEHLESLKRERSSHRAALHEDDAELAEVRKQHVAASVEQGNLQAEALSHERDIQEREHLIHTISEKYGIKGYGHSPLEEDRVIDFSHKLSDLRRRLATDLESIQTAGAAKTEDLAKRMRELQQKLDQHQLQRNTARDRINQLQTTISNDESYIDQQNMLDTELKHYIAELEATNSRLQQAKTSFVNAKYDIAIAAKAAEILRLNGEKDVLDHSLRALSLQADSRAKLALKKAEVLRKKKDIDLTLEGNSKKHLELTGTAPQAHSMELDIEKAVAEKERTISRLENESTKANQDLHHIETSISTLNDQLTSKRSELKTLTSQIQDALINDDGDPFPNVTAAIQDAQEQVNSTKEEIHQASSSGDFYETILSTGRKDHVCKICDRKFNDREWKDFEKKMLHRIQKAASESIEELKSHVKQWEHQATMMQALLPKEAARDAIKVEIPNLQKQLTDAQSKVETVSRDAESASEALKAAKTQLRELHILKTHASLIARTQKEVEQLQKEIKDLESDLLSSGSTETTDDIQEKIDTVSNQLKAMERERQNLITNRDQELAYQRTTENERHAHELKISELNNKLNERNAMQKGVESNRKEVGVLQERLKELQVKIQGGEQPIQRLEAEMREHSGELKTAITNATRASQELSQSADKLDTANQVVERYVRDRRARVLKQCTERIAAFEIKITELNAVVDEKRALVANVEKTINEGGATQARYRDNLHLRKLRSDLAGVIKEYEKHDIEEAARARRNFEKTYPAMEARLNSLKDKYSRLGGEISTQKAQLESLHKDLAHDFKDINKKYTDQLVKVKMSDMANNDLEKYAKALDNAIMKYHSLKMEEVNETMRHLWNKTYQGTDIDGIRIRSDNDGATSTRRTYNYRVVMSKDQVEMDMRGRCSAGQKMLASIIIRLALSDSFGQNCGILALDEPTNALDAENIDALAQSLTDIIKERRAMSNFQLIIITHDEKFLEKLGEADVMEYYWRVMRDRSQKSVIERQRFGIDNS